MDAMGKTSLKELQHLLKGNVAMAGEHVCARTGGGRWGCVSRQFAIRYSAAPTSMKGILKCVPSPTTSALMPLKRSHIPAGGPPPPGGGVGGGGGAEGKEGGVVGDSPHTQGLVIRGQTKQPQSPME